MASQASSNGGQSQPGALSDVAFDLVTLLSNCSEAIYALEEYLEDAKDGNDREAQKIFEQIHADEVRHAELVRDYIRQLVQQSKF